MSRDELIAALEKATGPDRNLDARIACLIVGATFISFSESESGLNCRIEHEGPTIGVIEHFTGSRDAMIPGAEKLLGVQFSGPTRHDPTWDVWIESLDIIGVGATEPLARRIAEIKALVKP